MAAINGTINGSSIDPNKQKRIRLTFKECQMISEALKFYDHQEDDPERKFSWSEIHTIMRRFLCLSDNDGYYARRIK